MPWFVHLVAPCRFTPERAGFGEDYSLSVFLPDTCPVGIGEYALLLGLVDFTAYFIRYLLGGLGVTFEVKTIKAFLKLHLWIFWQ